LEKIIFIGASNSFKEVYPIIKALNKLRPIYSVEGILDDNEDLKNKFLDGIPIIGTLDKAKQYDGYRFVFGIGSFKTRFQRKEILKRIGLPPERFITLIHPDASIDKSARIGFGAIIHPGVTICHDAVLEDFTITTFNVTIGPHAIIKKYAMVTTATIVLSDSTIGESAFIGVNSVIGENIEIGSSAAVVMGSVVFRNIPSGSIVQGNPAKVLISNSLPKNQDKIDYDLS